jgi:CheY-like chemotaxis protein
VKEALKLLRASLPTTIDIRQNISGDVGIVEADPTQIHQVLMNLCTNAHHAMEGQGGGILEIILSFENLDDPGASDYPDMEAGHYVRLVVRDGGEGIDPEVMDRIFEPYVTTKEKGKGTGMGLAVVHGIVKSYGGAIRVESEPGKGTSVEILLPATGSEPSPAIVIPEPMPTGQEQILFVDDEAPLVNLGRQMLENLGYRVEPRTSPIEAIAAFRAHPDKFDLVITDKTMPFMTGFDLAKEIKAIRPEIPIILCTGFSESADVRRAEALGINETLMKPLVLGDLARIIRQVLDGC